MFICGIRMLVGEWMGSMAQRLSSERLHHVSIIWDNLPTKGYAVLPVIRFMRLYFIDIEE